ncbi:MAG: HAD family phosphatase [Eubacterium sp.]|nr:HAD family phosphatase [Eubacterium sp.]
MIKAVIFDMDGLMFDSEPVSVEAWVAAGKKMGVDITREMVMAVFGHNRSDLSDYWKKHFGQDFDSEKAAEIREIEMQKYAREHGIPMKRGLSALLKYLDRKNYLFTIASSSSKALIHINTAMAGIADYFEMTVSGDEVRHGKPAPDIYLKAAQKLGVKPEECLVLEDSPAGIAAGAAAGMKTIMVPDMIAPTDKERAEAEMIADSLEEVIPWLENENAAAMTA